jgi:hypothetical protein
MEGGLDPPRRILVKVTNDMTDALRNSPIEIFTSLACTFELVMSKYLTIATFYHENTGS